MWIVREPGRAAQLGLVGTKANLAGLEATWPAYSLDAHAGGRHGRDAAAAFIVAYVFGREYAELTAKNLLALPVGRHWFVLAKFVVAAVWWVVLVVAVLVEAFAIGLALGLPGFSARWPSGRCATRCSRLPSRSCSCRSSRGSPRSGRGYMAPLGFALAMLALGNVFGKTGWAEWFPWSIVPLFIGMVGRRVAAIAQLRGARGDVPRRHRGHDRAAAVCRQRASSGQDGCLARQREPHWEYTTGFERSQRMKE